MLVQSVLQFIENLKQFTDLIPSDRQLRIALINHFKQRRGEDFLGSHDIQFILDCYKKRWLEVINSSHDYTLNPAGINQIWIQFAKDFAPDTNRKYYQILLPTVTNTVDFNNLSQLTETERMDNFYLDQEGVTLYRKRGLCERLLNSQFLLSTCRDLSVKRVSFLTVDELARLKVCKQINGEFSINDEKFGSFWDFLQKKVFPQLQAKGAVPLNVLPELLGLIEEYYRLKSSGSDFDLFKNAAKEFFGSLNQIELNNINFLYGIRIPCYESEFYLLDFLITINQAKGYEIDRELNALAVWLNRFNGSLKSERKELKHVYEEQNHTIVVANSSNEVTETKSDDSLHRSCCAVVSLMTATFDFMPFTGVNISLWDISNTVSSEAAEFYRLFEEALESQSYTNLIPVYQHIINNSNHRTGDSSILSWFSLFKPMRQWLQLIEKENFPSEDVYWFEPELIFNTLFHFKGTDLVLNERINLFLDNLIQTYAQDKSDMLKAFRVNILFSQFMKKLNVHDKTNIYRLINLHNLEESKSVFLNNCAAYIGNRLTHFSSLQSSGPVHFFVSVRKLDSSKLLVVHSDIYQVNEIIDAYKQGLHSPELHLDRELLDKMFNYLRGLGRPILSVVETEVARQSACTKDYLGSPT